ncbi:alpha/beta hydrolase [Asanoa sp. NPDC050611]|uniref:alpha/beta fold hydrolase n=1 Tax=Asanoa sp. NPDC050611 TaxID=3157098 RepID=UPI0033D23F11
MSRTLLARPDVSLLCHDDGAGSSVVVLLHGLAGSAGELAPTAASLVGRHRVIAFDQRGHGHSTRRPADVSREAYVADVIAVLDALVGADAAEVTLVGQSMGAHTALLTAAWHPDRVQRLVLLEGGVGGDADSDYPHRLGQWFASWPVPFPDERAAVDFLGSTKTAKAWARDLERRPDGLWPRFDADIMTAAIGAVAARARWAEWGRIRAGTTLVRGSLGSVPDDQVARMLEMRPEVDHIVIPDAGHDVHLDRPAVWFATLAGVWGTPTQGIYGRHHVTHTPDEEEQR